jgi:steroid delta-isomerase-like uncharacterized protein
MSTEESKAFVRRYYETMLDGRDLSAVDEFLAPTFTSHGPSGPGFNREAHVQMLAVSHAALPDLHLTIEDQIAEGDKVVTRWSAHGTHRGAYLNLPPTGKAITAAAIHIHRLEAGKIVEQWEQFDLLGVLQQLSAMPVELHPVAPRQSPEEEADTSGDVSHEQVVRELAEQTERDLAAGLYTRAGLEQAQREIERDL